MDPERKIIILSLFSFATLILVAISVIFIWAVEGFNLYNPKVILIAIVYFVLQIPIFRLHGRTYEEWISD
jgi:hypothetical protein